MPESTQPLAAKRGVVILRLGTGEWTTLRQTRREGVRFSLTFTHAVAHAGPSYSWAIIAVGKYASDREPDSDWYLDLADIADEPPALKIGIVRSVQAISTFDSRVVFDIVQPIAPDSLDILLSRVVRPALRSSVHTLRESNARYQRVSEKLGQELVRLTAQELANAAAMRRINAILRAPTSIRDARAMQRDAVRLALKAFGLTDATASAIQLSGEETALEAIRLREDTVIEHDARSIPGWQMEHSYMTGRATFTQNGERLEVFTANKQPLEELFGVDLIYLNHARQALVMVQYKMLEPRRRQTRTVRTDLFEYEERDEQEWTASIDKQFKEELARMSRFDRISRRKAHSD